MENDQHLWRIVNVKIVTEKGVEFGSLTVENGVIASLARSESGLPADEVGGGDCINGEGGWLLPGFVDLHVHGGNGGDFMDADPRSYDGITRFHGLHGTTAMLATTVTAPKDAIARVVAAAAAYRAAGDRVGAKLAGVHVEGPFISPAWPGAQNPAHISPPRLDWVSEWCRLWPDTIRLITLAPETEGATELIAWLSANGITAACGHTGASYEQIQAAVDSGLSHAAHTFNAMKPLHHRQPGTVGAVLTNDAITAELIADGHHVHPAAIQLLVRCKPPGGLILITDAIAAAGLGDGDYNLGGLSVTVKSGVAVLAENGSLAGSTLTMASAFRYMAEHSGLSVPDISRLASANPARRIGLFERTGSIEPGKQADLVWMDDSLRVRGTWVDGVRVTGETDKRS